MINRYLLSVVFATACAGQLFAQQSNLLILDADTANEIDDMYAITRMLKQDKYKVLGLSSAQWFHYLGERNSMAASQKINEELLELLGRKDLPAPMGSEQPMGKPWGGDDPKDSPAAQFIIQNALKASPSEKLNVVCLGASTNLASAIKLRPEIAHNIEAYILGFQYDWKTKIWNKSEFNIRRDLNAADFLLNCKELSLHIMPTSVAGQLKFSQTVTFSNHEQLGRLGRYMTDKWLARFAESKTWTMWDLALVEALLNPQLATEAQVKTPPENNRRDVWMYRTINAKAMQEDYWKTVFQNAW